MRERTNREPDFGNLLKVLSHQKPDRPTLFEFFMNPNVYEAVAGPAPETDDPLEKLAYMAKVFAACGYDHVDFPACNLSFSVGETTRKDTISLNEHACIQSQEDFDAFPWPNLDDYDFTWLDKAGSVLPGKMKIMVPGPNGLLENVISMVGYENLCLMLYDDPELVGKIFDRVGGILLDYYDRAAAYDAVGMLMINDDWSFNAQTMLSPKDMRRYVFPWHKKMVECAHRRGKPAVLHSCGYMVDIIDDIIYDMKFDGRHSYEDNIVPVEEAYRLWGDKIAILGGIDVDFLIRSDVKEIQERARHMLELSKEKGGYALGSGNSIPEYIPNEKFFAMIDTALQ